MDEKAKPGIQVVLNGGKREMNSATLPIEWWFSKEVIEKKPEYILIFEQNKDEKELAYNANYGRRYLCKVSEAIKFLQIFSAGYHRLMVIAIAGYIAKEVAEAYLDRENTGHYQKSLNWKGAADIWQDEFIAFTVEEFEVPEELFAKKPQSKFGKLIWKWTNKFFENAPRDECHYRKRKIFAFTAQPLLVLSWYLIRSIGGAFYALYVLLASLLTLFFGYRPRPIFKEMWEAFKFQRDAEWSVRRYGYKYMSIAPWCVFLILVAIVGLIYLIKILPFSIWLVILTLIILVGLGVFISYLIIWLYKKAAPARKRREERVRAEAERRKKEKEELRQKWLAENFELSKKTDEIYLDKLPTPLTRKEKIVQKFYVGFWTLKARVCKPYQK